MQYNFDEIYNRKNTNSLKWDFNEKRFGNKDILPMWVADMDFKAPSPVIEEIRKRAEHGIYGYTLRPASYFEAIACWMGKRHNYKIENEWIINTPGVVPALNISVLTFTNPGDKIIVQSPVYYPFFSAVKKNGRQVIDNPLKFENEQYKMDFEDLKQKIDSRTRMIIISSPHNPVGRVWDREELLKLGEICVKNNIIIVCDEIHSDIIFNGSKHIPLSSISDKLAQNTITCMAPSKTFNIAGLSTSFVIISNPVLRNKFNIMMENMGLSGGNLFGITALESAYRYGEEWLDQLLEYLQGNLEFMIKYFEDEIPEIKVIKPQGTYLVWLDCRGLKMDDKALNNFFIEKAKIALDDGLMFGPTGSGFQRINIACPHSILLRGLEKIKDAIEALY